MSDRSCRDCVFSDFMVIDTVDQHGDEGEIPHRICRRYPPVMVTLDDAAGPTWPVVHDTEWCGEFVRG